MKIEKGLIVNATPNHMCPACNEKRRHKEQEFKTYHKEAGSGYFNEHGASIKK